MEEGVAPERFWPREYCGSFEGLHLPPRIWLPVETECQSDFQEQRFGTAFALCKRERLGAPWGTPQGNEGLA